MDDAKLREKVFAAAARLPCDKNDLGEAMTLKRLRESSQQVKGYENRFFAQLG
jgi:hypothetical protein